MLKLFSNILDQKRFEIWEKLIEFKNVGVLAGGTALALQLNHRKSFDFDVFSSKTIPKNLILKARDVFQAKNIELVVDSPHELTFF